MHQFNIIAKKFGMVVSTSKIKYMTTSRVPFRCKFTNQVVKKEIKFKCFGEEVSSFGDVEEEVRGQAMKAARTTACLNNIIWNIRYIKRN